MRWPPSTELIGEPGNPPFGTVKPPLPELLPAAPISYQRQWLLTLLLVASAWYFLEYRTAKTPPPTKLPSVAPSKAVDWFLVLRLPEAPADAAAQAMLKERLDGWLSALQREKFVPMRLTDAWEALNSSRGLPPKGVVLVFDPGMRRTYECVTPVLVRHRCPGVWLSDRRYMDRPDSAFLSPHEIGLMKKSGFWDIGFYNSAAANYVLDIPISRAASLSKFLRPFTWDGTSYHQALNRGLPSAMPRLNVNLAWTGDQLVDYLRSEIPVHSSAKLTYRPLYHRFTGMAVETTSQKLPSPFDLEPNLQSRSTTLSWPSTAGVRHYVLDAKVDSLVGEMWILLQSDPLTGRNIGVGFKEGAIVVRLDGARGQSLARWRAVDLKKGALDARIILTDKKLSVRANGKTFPPLDLQGTSPSAGMVQFYIQDRVRGAAQARGVDLTLSVLP